MMVATINSIVTGAGITLLLAQVLPLAAAIVLGLVAAAVHLVLFYLYQRRRYSSRPALPDLPGLEAAGGAEQASSSLTLTGEGAG